jgi:hypothetical protein
MPADRVGQGQAGSLAADGRTGYRRGMTLVMPAFRHVGGAATRARLATKSLHRSPAMKFAPLAAALLLAGLPLAANASDIRVHHTDCDVHTDWSVRPARLAYVFSREDHAPGEVGIGGGRLFIDGKEQTLSAADHARITRLESEMHALEPQLRQVVTEAVEIAFSALTEVSRGLASDPKAAIADLDQARARLHAQMDAKPLSALDGDAIGATIAPIFTQFVPQIVGGAVTGALSAAFGGEEKSKAFEDKMKRMEQQLDSKVESRAKELEPLADAMCVRLKTMDRFDDELEYRLPDGGRLELLRVGQRDKD